MIRLPPTAIGLGRRDIWEFDNRRQKRKDAEIAEPDRRRVNSAACEHNNTDFVERVAQQRDFLHKQTLVPPFEAGYDGSLRSININTASLGGSFIEGEHFDGDEHQKPTGDLSGSEDHCVIIDEIQEEEYEGSSTTPIGSPRNTAQFTPRLSSPSRDKFRYGGFVESPTQELVESISGLFSPFAPPDISTPQNLHLAGAQRLRIKLPLPRSPLFISHNASSSPERPLTSSLTPHVESRVALYNTPGIIFAEPARRPQRCSPRTFRHQSNSFSFDSSERASVAYEQERVVSTSTINSTHGAPGAISLHQELQGSSLQSSRATPGVSAVSFQEDGGEAVSFVQNIEDEFSFQTESNHSSPRMPLPFSAVSRKISNTSSLPSLEGYIPKHPTTSPIGPALTPARNKDREGSPSVETARVSGKSAKTPGAKSPRGYKISPQSLQRLFEACSQKLKSPLGHHGSADHDASESPPQTPCQTKRHPVPDAGNTRTPHSSFMVYDDELSPATQPQTPAELPEARHQSRYHPSFTAPVRRGPFRRRAIDTGEDGMNSPTASRRTHITTSIRGGRSLSPSGMIQEGFRGLYGGRENGDEERNWVEGVRSDNAEARLWGVRDAMNDDRNLRETPEPEDWRVGRRE